MQQKVRIVLLSLAFGLSTWAVMAQKNVVDEVVWIVGDDAILKSQVEEQYRNMQYEGQKIDGDPYCVIPEQMAIQKLFLHQAKLDSISITEAQVMQSVEQRMSYFIANVGSKEKLEEYFNKPASQIREELSEMIRDQGTVEEMQSHLVKGIKVTPSEVRRYFSDMPADSLPFVPTQVEVQMIMLHPRIPQQEIDNIKNRLREYSERVVKGQSEFSTLAVLYSEDQGSAGKGGELGFMGKGELVPEYANVAFNLNDTKKVSKIVESEFGFHIIQMIEKRGDRINTRHILLKPKVAESDLKASLSRLDSLRNDILASKVVFEEATMYLSQDKDTRNNKGLMVNEKDRTTKFELSELPQDIAKEVSRLKVGEISQPFSMVDQKKGKEVIAIVKLKSRTEGHRANMTDDYQALKSIVENRKKSEFINDWIKNKQKQTYIRIKEGWRNCEFKYDGWVAQ